LSRIRVLFHGLKKFFPLRKFDFYCSKCFHKLFIGLNLYKHRVHLCHNVANLYAIELIFPFEQVGRFLEKIWRWQSLLSNLEGVSLPVLR
jgi:hypothetical protein